MTQTLQQVLSEEVKALKAMVAHLSKDDKDGHSQILPDSNSVKKALKAAKSRKSGSLKERLLRIRSQPATPPGEVAKELATPVDELLFSECTSWYTSPSLR